MNLIVPGSEREVVLEHRWKSDYNLFLFIMFSYANLKRIVIYR